MYVTEAGGKLQSGAVEQLLAVASAAESRCVKVMFKTLQLSAQSKKK